jgi:hypothetical protein
MMRYRGIEYSLVQGLGRHLWKWSASVADVVITGQAATKSEAVREAERGLTGRSHRKSCGLFRCLDAGIDRRGCRASVDTIEAAGRIYPFGLLGPRSAISGPYFEQGQFPGSCLN